MRIVPEKRQRSHVGQRFGRRTVLGPEFYIRIGRSLKYAVVQCDCGTVSAVNTSEFFKSDERGKSCGCLSDEVFVSQNSWHAQGIDRKRHGDSRPDGNKRLHQIWIGMRRRCRPGSGYEDYEGRGIVVCQEWDRYEVFREWALANGYEPGLSIDRRDNSGNYEPGNCRWTTANVQMNNTRWNRWVEAFGEKKTVAQWCKDERCVPTYEGLRARLNAGMDPEEALTRPIR